MKVILAILVLAGSCVGSQKTPPADLRNTRWVLKELQGKPVVIPEGGREAFILFAPDDTKVSGMGSCNNFFGTAAIGEKTISFSGLGSTRMACPDMTTENGFFQVMEGEVSFSIKGNEMTWQRGEKVIARFEAINPK